MLRKVLILLSVPACIFQGAISQTVIMPEMQGYRKVTSYPVYTRDNLWDFINGAADSYLSYGFEELHVAEYKKGRNVIKLEVYTHRNNLMAFGIYSSERSPSFRFINIGAQGYRAGNSLNFLKGRYYVKIRTSSESEKIVQSLESLAIRVSDMLQGEAALPNVLAEFPESGKKTNEEVYIGDGVLGHDFLKGAFRASYATGDLEYSAFIIDMNKPEDVQKTVSAWLSKAGIESEDYSGGKYVFRDGYNGDIFLSWKEDRIVFLQGLPKDETAIADRIISEIIK